MPRSHPAYPPECRRQMIELVREGRTPEELSREIEPSAQTICNWVAQAEIDEGRRAVFSFIEGFYNPSCRHSALGYLSPADFELRHRHEMSEVA